MVISPLTLQLNNLTLQLLRCEKGNIMDKNSTIKKLTEIKRKSKLVVIDGQIKIVSDITIEEFIEIINNAISWIKNDAPDYKDI